MGTGRADQRRGAHPFNGYRYIRWSTPYGGMKASGWGRENGIEALDSYLETRTTMISTTGTFPYPYLNRGPGPMRLDSKLAIVTAVALAMGTGGLLAAVMLMLLRPAEAEARTRSSRNAAWR